MRQIKEYIDEALTSTQTKQCEIVLKMLAGSALTKDNFVVMLSKLDMNELEMLSKHIASSDGSNYIAYQPNDDEFIKDSNKASIIAKMAEYLNKYVSIVK